MPGVDDLAGVLDRHAFGDQAGCTGTAALELGRVEEQLNSGATNGSAPFFLLAMVEEPVPSTRVRRLERDALERALAQIDGARLRLGDARLERPDGALIRDELRFAANLNEFGLRLGLARLAAGGEIPVPDLPQEVRGQLAEQLGPLVKEHGRLWRARSRPGGYSGSEAWLTRVLALLR